MRLALVWVGKTRDRRLADLIGEYVERIRRYCNVEITELREPAGDSKRTARERIEREGERILEAMKPGTLRIAFDEGGNEMTSREFAGFLGRTLEGTPAGVTLVFGGPYGLSPSVLRESQHRCSLSKMTLTHEMARLVALDQVYRAFTILRGEGYHH